MKGRSIWTYPSKLNNNMDTEKVEVKYVGGAGRLSPSTALPLTSTKFSLLLSVLSLVIAVSFFCLVLAWLWGVPEKIAMQNQEVERLEHLLEEQQEVLDEIISSRNKPVQWKAQSNAPGSSSDTSSCLLPPSPGPCTTSSLQRWHYHAPSGRCRQFAYGGCHGNPNNFVTARRCEETCDGVKQPSVDHVGPRFRGIVSAKNTGPKVPTKDEWRKRCLLPPTAGPCRGQLTRYYWDENISSCSTFFYGGCAGNTNNFITQQECVNSCRKESSLPIKSKEVSAAIPRLIAPQGNGPVSQCMQDSDPGDCTSSFLRWYFDSKTSACRKFTWGGCGGNNNNFLTEAKCVARCDNAAKEEEDGDLTEVEDDVEVTEEESRDEICAKPAAAGKCRGSLPRFFYNLESEKCEEFSYGGCGGNKNNFLTEESCKKNCVHV